MSDLGLVLRALRFAAKAHRDQRRKGSGASPYINHPIEVAHVLVEVGGVSDEEVVAAALLHDTVEDTVVESDELEARFGSRVRRIVGEVTDDKTLPKAERKRLQVEHAPALSVEGRLVKLADKIVNVHDVAHAPPEGWSDERRMEYLAWTERVVEGCRGVNDALEARYDALLAEAKEAVGR